MNLILDRLPHKINHSGKKKIPGFVAECLPSASVVFPWNDFMKFGEV